MGIGFLSRVMKIHWNPIVVMVTQAVNIQKPNELYALKGLLRWYTNYIPMKKM